MMTHSFDPLVARFVDALREALPSAPPREIYWGYQFLTGALTLTFAETGRIDALSKGLCRSADLDSVIQRMPTFMAAGFHALAERTQTDPGRTRITATRRGRGTRKRVSPNE